MSAGRCIYDRTPLAEGMPDCVSIDPNDENWS